MRWFLVLVLLMLAACSQQYAQELPTGHVRNSTNSSEQVLPPDLQPVSSSCKPDNLLIAATKDNRSLGLVSLSIENKGTYYKITKMTVYGEAASWYMNDITLEVSEPNSGLMDFTKQQVAINPATPCFVQEIPLNINLKNLTNPKQVELTLGQGQNRAGLTLVSGKQTLDLKQFVR